MRPCFSLTATVALFAALSSTLIITAAARDHMQLHSLQPPILEEYWESGLRYWSFGSGSVVTDEMVRLSTSEPNSHGYLWNRHPNHLESFEFNVTMRIEKLNWVGNHAKAGLGVWYTTDTPRHGDHHFFGAPSAFAGLGVTVDHRGEISVFVSDGYKPISDVTAERRGSCRTGATVFTITITYNAGQRLLHVGYLPRPADYSYLKNLKSAGDGASFAPAQYSAQHRMARVIIPSERPCVTLADIQLPLRNYFGVTANNDPSSHAVTEVDSFFVHPLSAASAAGAGGDASAVEDAEEEVHNIHMLDHILEIKKARRGEVPANNTSSDAAANKNGHHHHQHNGDHRPRPPHMEV